MKEKRSSFVRLWGYLKAYRFAVIFATLLKILSVVMSVIEPYILGLAITELTANLIDMARGVAGAQINAGYVGWVMVVYLFRGVLYELGSYYSNYFMTNAVQSMIEDMRNDLSKKSIVSLFLTLISTNLEIFLVALLVMSKRFPMPCNSPFFK